MWGCMGYTDILFRSDVRVMEKETTMACRVYRQEALAKKCIAPISQMDTPVFGFVTYLLSLPHPPRKGLLSYEKHYLLGRGLGGNKGIYCIYCIGIIQELFTSLFPIRNQ